MFVWLIETRHKDYNVIRALPYYKESPVIVNTFRINKNNKHFDSIQIKNT